MAACWLACIASQSHSGGPAAERSRLAGCCLCALYHHVLSFLCKSISVWDILRSAAACVLLSLGCVSTSSVWSMLLRVRCQDTHLVCAIHHRILSTSSVWGSSRCLCCRAWARCWRLCLTGWAPSVSIL